MVQLVAGGSPSGPFRTVFGMGHSAGLADFRESTAESAYLVRSAWQVAFVLAPRADLRRKELDARQMSFGDPLLLAHAGIDVDVVGVEQLFSSALRSRSKSHSSVCSIPAMCSIAELLAEAVHGCGIRGHLLGGPSAVTPQSPVRQMPWSET